MKIPGISRSVFFIEKEDVEACREFYSNFVNEFINGEESCLLELANVKPDAMRLRTATLKISSSLGRLRCLIYKK